jgi:hypothetical protein
MDSSFEVAVEVDGCATDTTCVEQNASQGFNHELAGRRNVPPKKSQIQSAIWGTIAGARCKS